jgi:hypothetical protein
MVESPTTIVALQVSIAAPVRETYIYKHCGVKRKNLWKTTADVMQRRNFVPG